jgi:hypothetical protein
VSDLAANISAVEIELRAAQFEEADPMGRPLLVQRGHQLCPYREVPSWSCQPVDVLSLSELIVRRRWNRAIRSCGEIPTRIFHGDLDPLTLPEPLHRDADGRPCSVSCEPCGAVHAQLCVKGAFGCRAGV